MYVLSIFCGVICAWIGGDMFVRGAVGFSRQLGLSAKIVGGTIAAFATSSPELAVAITASLSGENAISLGDALGSNIVNIMLILGLATLISPLKTKPREILNDYIFAAIAPLFIFLLAWDGIISRFDALALLGLFGYWLICSIRQALAEKNTRPSSRKKSVRLDSALFLAGGVLLLIAAGRFIVYGATNIALGLGISPFIIGATIVAISTGTPEIATTIVARWRGHDDLSLGTILGSNIFNALFVVAWAALITPIQIKPQSILLPVLFGSACIIPLFSSRIIGRKQAVLLLIGYICFVLLTIRG